MRKLDFYAIFDIGWKERRFISFELRLFICAIFVRKLFENSLLQLTRISTSCKIYFKLINNMGIRIGFVEISS